MAAAAVAVAAVVAELAHWVVVVVVYAVQGVNVLQLVVHVCWDEAVTVVELDSPVER